MEDEDIRPKPSAHEIGMPLDRLSIAELEERISMLEAEIERLRAAISSKSDSRAAAESVFKF